MEHFSVPNLRRAFLTTSIVAATCLSLTLVVVPQFRAAHVKRAVDDLHQNNGKELSQDDRRCVADNFDPQKGPWRYRVTQYNEVVKNRLLKRANALPQNEVRRADLLLTIVLHYGNHVSLSDKGLYTRQALAILESACQQKQKRDNTYLSSNTNPYFSMNLAKQCLSTQNEGVDQAAGALAELCEDLATPSMCKATFALSEYPRPNLEKKAQNFYYAYLRLMLMVMSKIEPPSHSLANRYFEVGFYLEELGLFNQAVDAFKKALEIDDLCFPDKTIKFENVPLSQAPPFFLPILTDCESLADAYMEAAMYQEAALMYRRAIATLSAIKAKEASKRENLDFLESLGLNLNPGLKTAMRLAAQQARTPSFPSFQSTQ